MDDPLTGKAVAITGAASGIGLACARRALAAGQTIGDDADIVPPFDLAVGDVEAVPEDAADRSARRVQNAQTTRTRGERGIQQLRRLRLLQWYFGNRNRRGTKRGHGRLMFEKRTIIGAAAIMNP